MSAVVGELVWKVTGDTSGIDKSIKQTDQKAQGLAGNFKNAMGIMAGAIIGAGIAQKIFDIGKASLKAAADMETQTVAFTTMLGSADKAQALIKQVSQFAASTPFQLTELIDASKKLVAFGVNSENVTNTLRKLGDVSAGLSIPIGELSEIYGKAMVQGNIFAEDLNQLAGRGIPIFSELAKVMGVNASEIKKLGSEGKITFNELEQVFTNLTAEGGQFGGLMEAQSATLAGKWSNFNDKLDRTAILLGQKLAPAAGEFLDLLNVLFETDEEAFTRGMKAQLENLEKSIELEKQRKDGRYYSNLAKEMDQVKGIQIDINATAQQRLDLYRQIIRLGEEESKIQGLIKGGEQIRYNLAASDLDIFKRKGELTKEQLEAIKNENKERGKGKELTDAQKKWLSERLALEKEVVNFINQNTKSETELLKMELDERKSALLKYSRDREQTAKWIADIEQIYSDKIKEADKKSFQERLNNINTWVSSYGSAVTGLLGAIQSLNEAQGAQAIASLDARMEAELEAAGLSEETAVEKAEAELKAAEESGDAQTINEKKKALEKAKIEEKYAKQKAKLEYEIALQSWELQRAMALVQMLQAPLNAFTSTLAWAKFPGGMALAAANAAIAALTAGIQFAAVDASKPQAPKFEQGGIVPGSSYSGDNMLARVNSGEMILNQQQQAQLFNVANGGGGGYRQVPPMSEDSLWKMIFEASQSGDLFIAERAVTGR